MHDTIDERLTELGGSLEAAAEIRSPMLVRSRGEQLQGAHRRRMAAATAVSAAVVVLGVGGLVALRPGGGHRVAPVNPDTSGPTSVSSVVAVTPPTTSAVAPSATSATAAKPVAVVDLKLDVMTVYGEQGQVVKTIPVTGGSAAYPSRAGIFTISAKQKDLKISTAEAGTPSSPSSDYYTLTIPLVITLDGGPPLYAQYWDNASFGKVNTTHGYIGMSTESAQWLYNNVAVGERIQIQ